MGIWQETVDYWTKPGLGERLRSLFGDNAPAGAERLVRPGEQIERQVEQHIGGGGGDGGGASQAAEPREPRPRRDPD